MILTETKKPVHRAWIRRGILIVLVLAAAWLWWTEGREVATQEPMPAVTPVPEVQNNERFKREESYEHDVAALQKILESQTTDESTRDMAAQKLTQLIAEHQNEIGLEEALRQAGYSSAVVIVQNGAVTVMIPQELFSEEASAQILALCVAHTDAGAENVRVMALK